EQRHEERRQPARATLLHEKHLVDERLEPAHTGPDRGADPLGVGELPELRVGDRLRRGGHTEVGEAVGAADLLAVHVLRRIEVLDLARDLRLVRRWVELCDAPDAAPSVCERIPVRRGVGTERRDHADAGHDDATRHDAVAGAVLARIASMAFATEGLSVTFTSFTSAMRFTSPFTTGPPPNSTNVPVPRSTMKRTDFSHSTRWERCRTSASGIAETFGCGRPLTFAMIGTTGSRKRSVAMNVRRSSPILPIAGKWNGAEMRSGTTFFAPPAASASVTWRMPASSPAIVTCAGPLSFATTTRPSSRMVALITFSTSAALMPRIAAIAPRAPRVDAS